MGADIPSKINEHVFQPPYIRAIGNYGTNIAAIIATRLSRCGPQAQTKVVGLTGQRTNNFSMKATMPVFPAGHGTILQTINAEANSQTSITTII